VVTAHQDASLEEMGAIFGAGHEDEWDYINKPFTPAEIRQKARNLASSWRRRREEENRRRDMEWMLGIVTELKRLEGSDPLFVFNFIVGRLGDFADRAPGFVVSAGDTLDILAPIEDERRLWARKRLMGEPELTAAVRAASSGGQATWATAFSVFPFAGWDPPRALVLLHPTPLPEDRRKLLRILADNVAATLESHRLLGELRGVNASLEERVRAQTQDLWAANRALHRAARTDPLTDVGNRLRLNEDLQALRGRAVRYKHRYCAALCDVDHFKLYNDHYGHLQGDEALKTVVEVLRGTLRSGDSVYRWGGEEFLVILPEQNVATALLAMERVRGAVEKRELPHAQAPLGRLTISVGVAALDPTETDAVERWIARADSALYETKGHGRNSVVGLEGGQMVMPSVFPARGV
jgi:diguanylate cyclase (GGDEF)-like protein